MQSHLPGGAFATGTKCSSDSSSGCWALRSGMLLTCVLDRAVSDFHTPRVANRRDRFREFMSRLDAAADPRLAIERGFYVSRPGRGNADQIVGRLELRPASTHLLVGGVGAGKTTQLLIARDRLNSLGDTCAIYIDVSRHQDLRKLQPGVLLTLAGLEVCALLDSENEVRKNAEKLFRGWAHGYEEYPTPDYDGSEYWVPGVVTPPSDDLQFKTGLMKDALNDARRALVSKTPHLVLIIDSLDRLSWLEPFINVIEQDVVAISSLGIGLVLIGPIQAIHGIQRLIIERFDHVYHQTSVDVARDLEGRDFMLQVLRQRSPEELLPRVACEWLVAFSGGVLRDLISLARQAVEEAYLDGSDTVTTNHVLIAADAFGRSLMIGLRQSEIEVLQKVRTQGSFVMTSEDDLALLATRRVLEYREAGVRYVVHPTLEPLLKQLAGES
jgi:hypothetical protein